MKCNRILRGLIAALACTGTMLPQSLSAAAPQATAAKAPLIKDVALGQGGLLLGQVVDGQGPVASTKVQLRQNDQEIVTTTTDEEGRFAVKGLRGGNYQVVSDNGIGMYRLWTPNTAPPSAQGGALLVTGDAAVRGQGAGSTALGWVTNPYVVTGLVATAIAVPIIIHNRDDDDSSS